MLVSTTRRTSIMLTMHIFIGEPENALTQSRAWVIIRQT